jgi:hypothetical protein
VREEVSQCFLRLPVRYTLHCIQCVCVMGYLTGKRSWLGGHVCGTEWPAVLTLLKPVVSAQFHFNHSYM